MTLRRRSVLAAGLPLIALGSSAFAPPATTVERWGLYEIALNGPVTGNPFVDVTLAAIFQNGGTTVTVPGFYDGNGVYRIRFSPPQAGNWTWTCASHDPGLNGKTGAFTAIAPSAGNHGPVTVSPDGYHFDYADGGRFIQIGTTAYAWAQQPDARCGETLQTLAASPFNKIRMCVFPNVAAEPIQPFAATGPGDRDWDPERFNPAYFRRFEDRIRRLQAIGVEADIILFHPYDSRHGWMEMTRAQDELYLRYVMARLSAFRNVWWSMANEFDLVKSKNTADFDHLLQVVQAEDPHGRLRSIHNCHVLYDNRKPWITHASVQNGSAVTDDTRAEIYRDMWEKPVVFDEICYEGHVEARWGRLRGQEMVSRFWYATIGGTYAGHSETLTPENAGPDASWAGKGGKLYGESAPRLAFLKSALSDAPPIDPIDKWWDRHLGGQPGKYYLRYFGPETPPSWPVVLPKVGLSGGEVFRADILDTWAMTVTPVAGTFTMARLNAYDFGDPARPTLPLPSKPWQAVRLTRL
ncbi:DUF5060 domain-containing protein [Asticcacaulis solisilvae]|uniref:DUF5060 domain-containing protein n=1 Tax=Asticcacaulis solisilvae TaxID=1217274 RepID=UPI003FD880DD